MSLFLAPLLNAVVTDSSTAAEVALGLSQTSTLAILLAIGLLLAGALLVFLEFFVISGGILALTGVVCVLGGVIVAFEAGTAAGSIALVAAPIAMIFIVRLGLKRLQESSLVPQGAVEDHAGYRHRAEELGIKVGDIGYLETPARPTGRAKFSGGELDVQVKGRTLDAGAAVRVISFSGLEVIVVAAGGISPHTDPPTTEPHTTEGNP